jgi:streptomycin 6-kinase
MSAPVTFDDYIARWNLIPDGAPIVTRSSFLLPVRFNDRPAMLKVAVEDEERRGNRQMTWWNGDGAARVFAQEDDALLMERLSDDGALAAMARRGADDEASRIICAVVARLHAARTAPAPATAPLSIWFEDLFQAADQHGGIFATAAATARSLLDGQADVVALHGDIHHGNILHSADQRWVAIDPKGLHGERGYDFANLFCNPDESTATATGRLSRQVSVVAEAARLDPTRLLQWILAHAALSAAWLIQDGEQGGARLAVAESAAAELGRT